MEGREKLYLMKVVIIFLAAVTLTASLPIEVEAQSRSRKSGTRRRPSGPVQSNPPGQPATPSDPMELTVDNASSVLLRQRTCLNDPSRALLTLSVRDGLYISEVGPSGFANGRVDYWTDSANYLVKHGWIRREQVDGRYFAFFTPEAERLFFSGSPPPWASVVLPSEEDQRSGKNRRTLIIHIAQREFVRIADVSVKYAPDMGKEYVVTALWRWNPTVIGPDFIRPRLFQRVFNLQRINNQWTFIHDFQRSDCSEELPFLGLSPNSTLIIEPSTIEFDTDNQTGEFNVFFDNHSIANRYDLCELANPRMGGVSTINGRGLVHPDKNKGIGETTLICKFNGLTATARVIMRSSKGRRAAKPPIRFRLQNQGAGSGSTWTETSPGKWVEKSADGTSYNFIIGDRIVVDNIPGTILTRVPDRLNIFVPDIDSGSKLVKYRGPFQRGWSPLGEMVEVEGGIDSPK